MGILNYIREQKEKFKAKQDLRSQQAAIAQAKELQKLKDHRIALKGRQKIADIAAKEKEAVAKLEAKDKERRRANSTVGKVAGFLQGARKELSALKSNEESPWRQSTFLGNQNSGAFEIGRASSSKKSKRKEMPQQDNNPWR